MPEEWKSLPRTEQLGRALGFIDGLIYAMEMEPELDRHARIAAKVMLIKKELGF